MLANNFRRKLYVFFSPVFLFSSRRGTKKPWHILHILGSEFPYLEKLLPLLRICYWCKYYKLESGPLVGLFHALLCITTLTRTFFLEIFVVVVYKFEYQRLKLAKRNKSSVPLCILLGHMHVTQVCESLRAIKTGINSI